MVSELKAARSLKSIAAAAAPKERVERLRLVTLIGPIEGLQVVLGGLATVRILPEYGSGAAIRYQLASYFHLAIAIGSHRSSNAGHAKRSMSISSCQMS